MQAPKEKVLGYTVGVVACTMAIGLIAGCSKHFGAPAASAAPPPSACEALVLKPADIAQLLQAPITHVTELAGDAQSCAFLTTGFAAVTVSVRPGLGRASLQAWSSGKMPLAVRPLPEVGDAAFWQNTLHEVIAQQNDLLCDIQLRGESEDIAVSADALPGELGALCSRIFAGQGHQVH
jgi:hypothetical protein